MTVADDDLRARVARAIFASRVSDHAGSTAPEIMDRCEEAADAVLAALSARPVQAQGADDGEVPLLAQAWAAEARKEREAHTAALARAEAAEAVIEKVRALDVDLLEWAIDEMGHTVYEETDTEPAECTDECPACAVEEVARGLRALLDGDSEGRES